ncbi:MAG: M48 family metallopeptidase [Dehalococcoidaceae bacterium]|nr:M48 family metallopeptidase [Dehalococcoidaceae bacterium]
MDQTRTINIQGIGPVLLQRSQRARRIIITVRPFSGVKVAVPLQSTFQKAEEFALSKQGWIIRHLAKSKAFENSSRETGKIDRNEAVRILSARLEYLAGKHGFLYRRVIFRNQKTRWGSCSAKNVISLNIQLMKLSAELADYVILHELLHTKIKNHSRTFWAQLDNLTGNARQARARLRGYGLETQ